MAELCDECMNGLAPGPRARRYAVRGARCVVRGARCVVSSAGTSTRREMRSIDGIPHCNGCCWAESLPALFENPGARLGSLGTLDDRASAAGLLYRLSTESTVCSTTCIAPSRCRRRNHHTAPLRMGQGCRTSASR